MAGTFQKNSKGPSYTSLSVTPSQNKYEKRETKAFANTEDTAEAIRGANKRIVTKESRHTGRK